MTNIDLDVTVDEQRQVVRDIQIGKDCRRLGYGGLKLVQAEAGAVENRVERSLSESISNHVTVTGDIGGMVY